MIHSGLEQSRTWPFELLHEDIPDGLIKDANIVGADACTITGILVSSDCIYVTATIHIDNDTVETNSGVVQMGEDVKVRLFNAVGKCYGWLLLGPVHPESLVVQGVSYDLCVAVCERADSPASANKTDMTGDWTIEEGNGITISPTYQSTLNISIGVDDPWFRRPSPDDADRRSGNGIYSIGGTKSTTITLSVDPGRLFVHGPVVNIVPPLVLYTLDASNNLIAKHEFFVNDENKWIGPDGIVEEIDGKFKVTINGQARMFDMNEMKGYTEDHQGRLDVLTTAWEGCPIGDMIRPYFKTSQQDNSSDSYPLDSILVGSNL